MNSPPGGRSDGGCIYPASAVFGWRFGCVRIDLGGAMRPRSALARAGVKTGEALISIRCSAADCPGSAPLIPTVHFSSSLHIAVRAHAAMHQNGSPDVPAWCICRSEMAPVASRIASRLPPELCEKCTACPFSAPFSNALLKIPIFGATGPDGTEFAISSHGQSRAARGRCS